MASSKRDKDTDPVFDDTEPTAPRGAVTEGRRLAHAKTKGQGKPTASEQEARLAHATAKKGRAPAPAAPEALLTADRAFRGGRTNAIVTAFLHEEKLRGGVRKLSRSDWKAEFDKFTQAPR